MNSAIHWQQKRWCKSSKGLIGMAIVPARKIRIPIDQNLDNQIWGLHFATRYLETLRYEFSIHFKGSSTLKFPDWHNQHFESSRNLTIAHGEQFIPLSASANHRHLILQDSWCQSYVIESHKFYKGLDKQLMKFDLYKERYLF